jgi:hypothetical protein
MIIKEEQIDNLDNQDLSVVATKTLIRKFGKPEDNVELFVYDLNGNLLLNRENFRGYKPPDNITDPNGLYNEINIDYTQTLKTLGFTSGEYQLILGFYRKVILNSFVKPFYISEISPSRREIKIKSDLLSDEDVIKGFNDLIGVMEASSYFREFILNFGNNIQSTGINFQIDSITEPTEVLIKLYDPLPNTININSKFRLTEEIINPVSITVDLGEPTLDQLIVGEEIKGPNLRIDTRLNSSKPSAFRTYDQILGGSNSSSFANISNYLSSSLELAIDFKDTDTDSGYHFENFIHFSSAVERLKNFRYKLQLMETYDDEINDIDTLEGSQTSSVVVIAERDRIENKKNSLIGNFDAYERFLYYESGAYAWPKTTSTRPFTLSPTDSNESKAWIGSEVYTSGYYGGQLLSGSEYDDYNIHRLTDTLPEHIVSNNDNDQYTLFVNMVAQHFDNIWIYIDHITNINQAENKLNRGISKDMVYDILERAGLKVFDQFENDNLFGYISANEGANGNFQYQAPAGQTMISASAAGSIPKGDITKEVWKRLYHNLPYLLKTKGTERGMKALISCYGIPESILNIKEYGGPNVNKTGFRTFSYQKESKMMKNDGSSDPNSYAFTIDDALLKPNQYTRTVQVRVLPDPNDHIIPVLSLYNASSNDVMIYITKSIDNSYVGADSASFGKLIMVTGSSSNTISSAFQIESNTAPFYNGKVWNITLSLRSGSDLGNTAQMYATYTNNKQNTYLATSTDGETLTTDDGSTLTTDSGDILITDPVEFETVFSQTSYGNSDIAVLPGGNFAFSTNKSTGSAVQEFRIYTELLTKDTIVSQSLSPFNYNGNTVSSSYETLFYRLPLGSDLSTLTTDIAVTSSLVNKPPNRNAFSYSTDYPYGQLLAGTYIDIEETHHLTTPDTVGKSMVSDKVRLDTGTIDDNILSPFIRSEESTQDRQPNDFSDLGVFFSPTFEVNEDIIYTLGGFRMDDYIGDPRHYVSSSYPDLKALQDIYVQKINNKIVNIWDYLKLVQQFDHTLFKMIEQFAPAKANLKTGVVIEPHYLERHKLEGLYINTDSTSYNLDLPGVLPPISSENSLHELDIDVYGYLVTGSGGDIENNAINSRLSSKFYTRVKPYNQLSSDGTPPINPNTGTPLPSIPSGD